MKKTTKKKIWMGILAITLVFGMAVVGCEDEPVDDPTDNNDGQKTDVVFTSIQEFADWLLLQEGGTDPANPLRVKLNVSSLYYYDAETQVGISLNNALKAAPTTYVSLDLSGSTMTSMHGDDFYDCPNLVGITIPASVTNMRGTGDGYESAFERCPMLVSIKVDSRNTEYAAVDGVLFKKDMKTLLTYPQAKTGAFTIPNSVTNIGVSAFNGCASLTSVTIPNSVTTIEMNAFRDCTSIATITIPNSVTSIDYGAFWGCTSLTSVTIPDSVTNIGDSVFNGTAWFNNQPDGLVYVGKVAYTYKGTMPANTSITLLDGTKGIAWGVFSNCANLVSVTIPNSVTNIGVSAFNGCASLTTVTIPNSVTSIGGWAFGGTSLTSVTIPASVTSIGDYAFRCSKLTSVTFQGTISPDNFGVYAFVYYMYDDGVRTKYLAEGIGTYIRGGSGQQNSPFTWTKQ